LFCAAAGLACASDDDPSPGTLVLTFGKEADQWSGVAHLRLRAGATASTATGTLYDGPADGASVDIGQIGTDGSIAFVAEATDAAGEVVARGQTPVFTGAELQGDVAPLLLAPVAGSSRVADGLTLPWRRGDGAALLGRRYVVLGNAAQTDAEAYDTGLLIPSVGGPGWSRPPGLLLAASTRDLFVLDGSGADLADIFSLTTPTTTVVTADEAADLLRGQVVSPPAGDAAPAVGQWIGGPCGEGDGTQAASDRVLYLAPDDQIVVTRLPAPRRGAACAQLADGSLVLAGGSSSILTIVSTGGTVVESVLTDDRANGAAIATSDGSVLLIGGTAPAGSAASPAPIRVALPCAGACVGTTIVPDDGSDWPAAPTRVVPTASGRAFVVSDRPAGTAGAGTPASTSVRFVDASLGGVTLTSCVTRVERALPVALGLSGERLLLAGGITSAGTGSTEVEIVNSP
jgi:hypothetical protein